MLTAVGVGEHPASAGGLGGGLLSPAINNGCANQPSGNARGSATAGHGTADGNHAAIPGSFLLNQCGGADLLPDFSSPQSEVPYAQCQGGDAGVQGLANDLENPGAGMEFINKLLNCAPGSSNIPLAHGPEIISR
ncbi:hypothetical protein [Streptomyces sp. NPDC046261]|uniref:hypothetical protein n=1 Tax=Streptomyces sp. NPDC046261 TaxID=3157200 RepID=UPI0033D20C7F